jgi:hypothetical protein
MRYAISSLIREGFISGLHKECGPMGLNVFWLIVPKLIMAMKVARIFSLWQWDRRNGRLQNQKIVLTH